VIKRGEQYDRPQSGQLVTVRCCGRLEDGTEIDRHDALTLVLGDADFIHGEHVVTKNPEIIFRNMLHAHCSEVQICMCVASSFEDYEEYRC